MVKRRQLLQAGCATVLAATASRGRTQETPSVNAQVVRGTFTVDHKPRPLPFNPKSLNGLSERLLVSHWENNYGGSVKALNVVRGKLRDVAGTELPPYLYNDFKREHLIRTGSVILHELYFGNLGGDGKPAAEMRSKLAQAFGSFDAWQSEFVTIGRGLGGGSGWVMLGLLSSMPAP
jgi:Fe-Mn family superoxide dismutase